jgi:hypothetical protein
MEKRCSKCGGKLVTGYLLTSGHLLGFTPREDEEKLRPRYAKAICETCLECGSIFDIRVQFPEKLKKKA